jgi:hypothetical protein
MTLRIRNITIDSREPQRLAAFWARALGFEPRELWHPFAGLRDPAGHSPVLTFQRDQDHGPNHLHLDIYADDPEEEATRLVGLGATRVRRVEEGDTWWWVLRDPEGNDFCLIARPHDHEL